ncbi:hypothetical protein SteCoe_12689 [Stentor coeruleus]|uniref:Uncharacterized protein n=1 Tax=Stentor coeruleus TaxID=5963 RepID=A0A1R2CA81_9CILI|nr:hypothetical protein SteCoe_12689 [Stentor coeruleus]
MINKDYLFGAPSIAAPVITGESERDRRLRLRADERTRRMVGIEASAYEGPSDSSKRDAIWEMKRAQRLGGIPENRSLLQEDSYVSPNNFGKNYQEPFEDPSFPQIPQKYDPKPAIPFQNFPEYDLKPAPPYQNFSEFDQKPKIPYQNLQEYDPKPAVPYKNFIEYPQSIDKPNDPPQFFDNQYKKAPESFSVNYQNKPSFPQSEVIDSKNAKDQQQYAGSILTDSEKKANEDANKKKLYAEELKRQIEEKSQRKVPENMEIGFEIGGNRRGFDKKQYAAELEAQIRAKKSEKSDALGQNDYFSGQNTEASEREKKLKYARDLQAQIKQKKQDDSFNRGQNEEYFPFQGQDNTKEKKRLYAEELQAQIREKNRRNVAISPVGGPSKPLIPMSIPNSMPIMSNPLPNSTPSQPNNFTPFQGYENNYSDLYQRMDYRPVEEEPRPGLRPFEQNIPSGSPQNVFSKPLDDDALNIKNAALEEKKLKYRQELERQIEEQKRRKEEEKRKLKQEEEHAEKRFVNDSGVDYSKPIARYRTVDPNKPSEENPQAERYKEHLHRAKGPKIDLPNERLDDPYQGIQPPGSTRGERARTQDPPQNDIAKKDYLFDQKSSPSHPVHYPPENKNIFSNFPAPGLPPKPPADISPKYYEGRFENEGDRQLKNIGSAIVNDKRPEGMGVSPLVESYRRELQETRLERDRAKEQCLEMREMMLKEKERNLEQMLFMLKNQTESRPVSLQEPRSGLPLDRPPLYGGYRNTPMSDNRGQFQDIRGQYMEGRPPGYGEYGGQRSDLLNDLYKPTDPYNKGPDIYSKGPDIYGKPSDIYGKPSDIYGKPSDIYGKPSDIYGKPQDLFGKPSDMFTKTPDPFNKLTDVYGKSDPYAKTPEPSAFGVDPYSKPQDAYSKAPGLYGNQDYQRAGGNAFDNFQDYGAKNPNIPSTEPPFNIFEKSLAGESKWVSQENTKWGDIKIIESTVIPEEPPESDNKLRKKWDSPEPPSESLPDSKNPTPTPRFLIGNKSSPTGKIETDDDALMNKIDYLSNLHHPHTEISEPSDENSIKEEIETHSDKEYSDAEAEIEKQEKSIEHTREITMSNPKYEEIEEHVVECDNWSESRSEAEFEVKNRQTKSSYNKPKIIDVFGRRPSMKTETTEKNKDKQKELEKEAIELKRQKELEKEAIELKSVEVETKKEVASEISKDIQKEKESVLPLKANPSQGRIAFSRLEEARKHAKEQKAKENCEENEVLTSKNLDLQVAMQKASVEGSIEGKFTRQALNELRKQKRQSVEESQKIKSSIEDSYKSSEAVDRDEFMRNFFNMNRQSKDEDENNKLPQVKPKSRRYEE